MATINWNMLRQAVATAIKTNGNQEITGQLLQDQLLAIISAIPTKLGHLENNTLFVDKTYLEANFLSIEAFAKFFALKRDDDGSEYLNTPYSLVSDKALSSLGKGEEPEGNVSYDRLDSWDDYQEGSGAVLSADLGYDLLIRIQNIGTGDEGSTVSFIQALTSGKLIGTLSIDGVATKLYAPATYDWTEIENAPAFIQEITAAMITNALGFTPYNASNPNGYISGITAAMITTALGFTPYDASNPQKYATESWVEGKGYMLQTAFTRTAIKNLLGISDWALAGTKPSYNTGEVSEGSNLYFTNARVLAALTGAISTVLTSNLTAARVIITNAAGKLAASAITSAELGCLSGASSNIQTQLNTHTSDIKNNADAIAVLEKLMNDMFTFDTDDEGTKYIRTKYSFSSDKAVSSLGMGGNGSEAGGSADWGAVPTDVVPTSDNSYTLGTSDKAWKAVYAEELYSGGIPMGSTIASMQSTLGSATSDITALRTVVAANKTDITNLTASVTALQASTFTGAENETSYRLTWFTSSGGARNVDIPSYSAKGFASIEEVEGVFMADYRMVYDILDYVDSKAGNSTVDLSAYYTKTDVDSLLNGYAKASALNTLNTQVASNTSDISDLYKQLEDYATTSTLSNYVTKTDFNNYVPKLDGYSEGSLMRKSDNYNIQFGFGQLYAMLTGYNDTLDTWQIDSEMGYAWFSDTVDASAFNQTSDATKKNVTGDAELSIDAIADAPLKYYTWKEGRDRGSQVGTLAQYWQEVLPEVTSGVEGKNLGVNYGVLGTAMGISLARELRELQKEVLALREELKALKGE